MPRGNRQSTSVITTRKNSEKIETAESGSPSSKTLNKVVQGNQKRLISIARINSSKKIQARSLFEGFEEGPVEKNNKFKSNNSVSLAKSDQGDSVNDARVTHPKNSFSSTTSSDGNEKCATANPNIVYYKIESANVFPQGVIRPPTNPKSSVAHHKKINNLSLSDSKKQLAKSVEMEEFQEEQMEINEGKGSIQVQDRKVTCTSLSPKKVIILNEREKKRLYSGSTQNMTHTNSSSEKVTNDVPKEQYNESQHESSKYQVVSISLAEAALLKDPCEDLQVNSTSVPMIDRDEHSAGKESSSSTPIPDSAFNLAPQKDPVDYSGTSSRSESTSTSVFIGSVITSRCSEENGEINHPTKPYQGHLEIKIGNYSAEVNLDQHESDQRENAEGDSKGDFPEEGATKLPSIESAFSKVADSFRYQDETSLSYTTLK